MAIIGVFTATKEGGWTGTVRTLAVNAKVQFVPNDNRTNKKAPAFRVLAGGSEVGVAWEGAPRAGSAVEHLDVKLDDPTWREPIWTALHFEKCGVEAHLIWRRAPQC